MMYDVFMMHVSMGLNPQCVNSSQSPIRISKLSFRKNQYIYLVHWVGEGLDPKGGFFDPAILTHFMASKWLKMAINVPFVAISRPGGSEMVDQRGSRLDQGRTHLGGCVGTIFGSGMAKGGRHRAFKLAQNGHKWAFCGHRQVWRLQNGGSGRIKVGSR